MAPASSLPDLPSPALFAFYRKRIRLSTRRLAREMGVTLASVKNWEHGRSNPAPRLLGRLHHALGLSPAEASWFDEKVDQARKPAARKTLT